MVDEINAELPTQIRVFGCTRVPRRWGARISTRTRHYEYLLPTVLYERLGVSYDVVQSITPLFLGSHYFHNFTKYCAVPLKSVFSSESHVVNANSRTSHEVTTDPSANAEEKALAEEAEDEEGEDEAEEADEEEDEDVEREHETAAAGSGIRLSNLSLAERLEYHRRCLLEYKPDPTVRRVVLRFLMSEPFDLVVRGQNCGRVVRVSISGSSFLMHQIRRMIGAAIAVPYVVAPHGIDPKMFTMLALDGPFKLPIPRVPSFPLCLHHADVTDGLHQPWDLFSLSQAMKRREQFHQETLLPHFAELFNEKNAEKEYSTFFDREVAVLKKVSQEELQWMASQWGSIWDSVQQRKEAKKARLQMLKASKSEQSAH